MGDSTTITPIASSPTSQATDPNFSLKCKRDAKTGEIKSLAIDKIALIEDSQKATSKKKLDGSVSVLKKDLEELFQEEEVFSDKKEFKVKSLKGQLQLHTKVKDQKSSQLQLFFKKIMSIFQLSTPKSTALSPSFKKKTTALSKTASSKIVDIQERFTLNKIFSKTALHNIEQLNDRPKTNSKITKMLLIALTIGILAGTIGIGATLPHLGVMASLGIPGIPLPISASLIGIGALSVAFYIGLRIAAKKSSVAKEYLNDIHLTKSQWFLECNLNDFTNGALFILMALTFIHAPWFATIKGCLAYPTGLLLIGSGVYQLFESFKDIRNNKKIGDNKEMIKAIANFACAITIITMGLLTTAGMINSPITIFVTMAAGALMAGVNAYNLFKSFKQLKEIRNIDENNPTQIFDFLQKSLSLSQEEMKQLKEKIDKMSKEDILELISKNYKNWEQEQIEIFKRIEKELKNSEDIELSEIRKMILNEEIKNSLESKIERFGAIVSKKTLQDALNLIDEYRKDPKACVKKLKELFIKIKSETKTKTIAETLKFLVINLPLMFVPFVLPRINMKLYDYLMGAILFSNISVNITPRFRNVPPTMLKKALDINNAIEMTTYREYKALDSSKKDPTISKTIKAADKTLAAAA